MKLLATGILLGLVIAGLPAQAGEVEDFYGAAPDACIDIQECDFDRVERDRLIARISELDRENDGYGSTPELDRLHDAVVAIDSEAK